MRQIFHIIPGGTQFALKNEGTLTCAASYQGAVVMIGGFYPTHGKVDRWEVNNNILFPISLPDTTRKATTSTLYPTFLRQDIRTPAPRSHLQEEKRFESKICIISLHFPGLVGRRRFCSSRKFSLKHGVVLAVKEAVDQRRRSSQAFHQNLINNRYHFDDDQIIITQMLVNSTTYTIAYCNSLIVSWLVWGDFFGFCQL